MKNVIRERAALLIGGDLRNRPDVINAILELSLTPAVVAGGHSGLGELFCKDPEIVLIGSDLSGPAPAELCRKTRLVPGLSTTPIVCVFGEDSGVSNVLDCFHSGADDCLVGKKSVEEIKAKLEWLLVRRRSAAAIKHFYSELQAQQAQTLEAVRATADLMASIDIEFREAASDNSELVAQKLEIGLGMIHSLTSILENQIRSFDIDEIIGNAETTIVSNRHQGHQIPRNQEMIGLTI